MKFQAATAVVFVVGLLGCTYSQGNEPSPDDILNKVNSVVDIPELNNLNTSALPIEEATNLFKQKCARNGGPNAFDNAKRAQEDMQVCLKNLINMTELNVEMERAKPNGELDDVFKKYCRKSPVLKGCVFNFTTAVEPCLDEKERENKRVILNITDSLLSFVCYNEGDRIALFISAGGPECFQSKQQEIQNCVNTTFGSYIPTTDSKTGALPGIESLPSLVLGHKECSDISSLQNCVVKELEKCTDPTPANLADSIFNFIKRVTPCENILSARSAAVAHVDDVNGVKELASSIITTMLFFIPVLLI